MKSLVVFCVAMVLFNTTPSKTMAQRQHRGRGTPPSPGAEITPQDADHVTHPSPTEIPADGGDSHSNEAHEGHDHENGDDFKPSDRDHDHDFGAKNHTDHGTDWGQGDEGVDTHEDGDKGVKGEDSENGGRKGFRPRGYDAPRRARP